jgi:hypothetical protein
MIKAAHYQHDHAYALGYEPVRSISCKDERRYILKIPDDHLLLVMLEVSQKQTHECLKRSYEGWECASDVLAYT